MQSWGYDQGGYQVQFLYRVTTPALTSEVNVTLMGLDNVDDSGIRQWYVKNVRPEGQIVMTDEGRRMS